MFGSKVGFSGSADRMSLFPFGHNNRNIGEKKATQSKVGIFLAVYHSNHHHIPHLPLTWSFTFARPCMTFSCFTVR